MFLKTRFKVPKRVARGLILLSITLATLYALRSSRATTAKVPILLETDAHLKSQRDQTALLSILHYNTHEGCARNLRHVLNLVSKSLDGFDYSISRFDPSHLGYALAHESAQRFVESGIYANEICAGHDVVVVSDTIPHARGLLLSLLHPDPLKRCTSTVILEITNRFDYAITDPEDLMRYYSLFHDLVAMQSNQLFWVANNNFERAYMEHRLNINMPFVKVLRPLGYTDAMDKSLHTPDNTSILTLFHNHTNVFTLLKSEHIPNLTIFPKEHAHYGGPQGLTGYKAYLEFPYQVSTMKLYENLAGGVVMLIPTPQFLEHIWKSNNHEILYHMWSLRRLPVRQWLHLKPQHHAHVPGFPQWSAYMDYYAPEFAPYLYYFGSWEELRELASLDAWELDSRRVAEGRGMFYEHVRRDTVKGWESLFGEIRERSSKHEI
ncbi:hypothetical protein BJ741DRAFT_629096 [Chytriomyces cf. hyalinus JEL632]|nr:hypothetical protein BJ741DRAFT_629096 [Chytriomyces cf. hyalinus JEL632]